MFSLQKNSSVYYILLSIFIACYLNLGKYQGIKDLLQQKCNINIITEDNPTEQRKTTIRNETMEVFSKSNPELRNFFVITTIFNPASYHKRYDLYQKFSKYMNETGAQLITIEAIFPILNQTEFQVTHYSNPNHIQIKSHSVYWMKENLINIAASRLPEHAQWICWLDADVEFSSSDWIAQTIKELKKYAVVQLFEKAEFLGPLPEQKVLRSDYSFGYSIVNNKPIGNYYEWYPHPGYGWAMSLENFRKIGGLPEMNIMGSGDLHFANALVNRVSNKMNKLQYNKAFSAEYISSSQNIYSKLSKIVSNTSMSIVGFVPIELRHFWHGSRKNRQYSKRELILNDNSFSFSKDLKSLENGLLEFKMKESRLQKELIQYFEERNEDSDELILEHNLNERAMIDLKIKQNRQRRKLVKKYCYCNKDLPSFQFKNMVYKGTIFSYIELYNTTIIPNCS